MRFVAFAILVMLTCTPMAKASLTGFGFAGELQLLFRSPFGGDFSLKPTPTPISGRILYDPAAPASDAGGCENNECLGYRQHVVGGISADFGGLSITADDFIVQVKNNDIHYDGVHEYVLDTIAFVYRFDVSPFLSSQLNVNGVAQPKAWFQINLIGAEDTFDDTLLPQSIDAARYNTTFNVLDEDATRIDLPNGPGFNQADIIFSATLSALAIPGDYNGDSVVTPHDYIVWRSTFGSTTSLAADGNGNQIVDAADYVAWRQNNRSDTVQPSGVPEPCILNAVTAAALVLASRANRLHRREI
jgi:hypothetical protein